MFISPLCYKVCDRINLRLFNDAQLEMLRRKNVRMNDELEAVCEIDSFV